MKRFEVGGKDERRGGMILFLVGLVVGAAWGAGLHALWKERAERKNQAAYLQTGPIIRYRVRMLRIGVFN